MSIKKQQPKKKSKYPAGQGSEYLSPRERRLIQESQQPPRDRPTDTDHDKPIRPQKPQ